MGLPITNGSGGVPLNGIVGIHTEEDLYTDKKSKAVFLRNGVIETDVSKYPDATNGYGYSTNELFDITSNMDNPEGIEYDPTREEFLVAGRIGTGNDRVNRFDLDFNPIGTAVTTTSQTDSPAGIVLIGNELFKYLETWSNCHN